MTVVLQERAAGGRAELILREAELIVDPTSPPTATAGRGVVLGTGGELLVQALAAPGMAVRITTAGTVFNHRGQRTDGATSASIAIAAADPANPRRDIVVLLPNGTYAVRQGTPAGAPVDPALTAGDVPLARVTVAALDATIDPGDITDLRQRATLAATAGARALIEDAFFTAAMMGPGAGGKWTASAFNGAAIAHLFAAGTVIFADGSRPMTADWAFGGFDVTGLDEVGFNDAAANASAAGRMRRNGALMTWHDGTAVRNVIGGDAALTATGILYATAAARAVSLGEASNGQLVIGRTGLAPVLGSLTAPAAGFSITGGAGTITFALTNDLLALEGIAASGFVTRTAADTWLPRTLTAPVAGFTITNPAGVAGDPTFVLANDLAAIEALGATGIAVRSAADTWLQRSVVATSASIVVAFGDGVGGNIGVDTAQNIQTGATPQFARLGLGAAADPAFLLAVAGTASWGMVSTNAAAQTLTIDAQNAGAGTGNLVLTADDVVQLGDAGNPAITQVGTGQVTFTGNVDANVGLDVTGTITLAGAADITGVDEIGFADAAAAASATGRLRRNATALEFHDGGASRVLYMVAGLDVAVADGGTGASTAAGARTNLGAADVARSLTAGAGLTGGGDLSADRTFTVGAGTGITVNVDDVAVAVGFAFPWTAAQSWTVDDASNATVTNVQTLVHTTSGAPAAGIGTGVLYRVEGTGGLEDGVRVEATLTDVAAVSLTSRFAIFTRAAGAVLAEMFDITGTTISFNAAAGQVRATASYTQTFATADRTHAADGSTAVVAADMADGSTAVVAADAGVAPAGGTGTAAGGWDTAVNRDAAIVVINALSTLANETKADFNLLRATVATAQTLANETKADFNLLRTTVDDLKQLVNSIIDDLQAYGLFSGTGA